jgi:hypothetical protein
MTYLLERIARIAGVNPVCLRDWIVGIPISLKLYAA